MIIDAADIQQDQALKADLTIIGAGAAGIALAREFVDSRVKVLLLEAGGLEYDEPTQNLYIGDVVGHDLPPLDTSRLRYFGGTTNHWSGFSRPFDAIDFEKRAYVPYRQLAQLFRHISLGPELFAHHAYTRLKQLEHLLRTGQIDADFFWREMAAPGPVDGAVMEPVS